MDAEGPDLDTATWLVGVEGRHAVSAARQWGADGADDLQVAERLRRDLALDAAAAGAVHTTAVLQARAVAAGHPDGWFWTRSGLEQASHPLVARWRARRYAQAPAIVDLTVGCGADAHELAAHAPTVGCDVDATRLVLARANLAGRVPVVRADATRPAVGPSVWRWADPSRRDGTRRLHGLDNARPALSSLLGESPAGVAVSPAVDLTDPALPDDAELEFVQVGSRLVEAVVWTGALREVDREDRATRSATILAEDAAPVHLHGTPTGELAGRVRGAAIGDVLVLPAPALVRARLHEAMAAELDLDRLSQRRAIFLAAEPPSRSPWLRSEVVVAVAPTGARPLRRALRALDVAELEVLTHGVDTRPADLLRAMGNPPTGPHGHRIHLVRTDAGAVALVTSEAHPSE